MTLLDTGFAAIPRLPALAGLCERDRTFLSRIYDTGPQRYLDRLHNIGLTGLGRVVDLGCGFGQWTLCLAHLNAEVLAIDPQQVRCQSLEAIAAHTGTRNISVYQAGAESLPIESASIDGVFCFGVLQYVDTDAFMAEVARVLRPNGIAYVNGKDIGGYVFDWREGRHRGTDYEPRQVTVDAFRNTLELERGGRLPDEFVWPDRIVPMNSAMERARAHGLSILGAGEEGSVVAPGVVEPRSSPAFFPGTYSGLPNAYEVLLTRTDG